MLILLFIFYTLTKSHCNAFLKSSFIPKFTSNGFHQLGLNSPLKNTLLLMFSGIVEEMGEVVELVENEMIEIWDGTVSKGTLLKVKTNIAFDDSYIGCSIAVNGVCLTATELYQSDKLVTFGLAPETLRCTNLGLLQV